MPEPLETERLHIRQWTMSNEDRAFFHHLHSDEDVRRFYVTRFTHEKADEFLEELIARYETGEPEWMLVTLKKDRTRLGFSGISHVGYTPPVPCVETGWMYSSQHWGKGYATEAATRLLQHGFEDFDLDEIVAFAVHNNHPSIDVMKRIGMTYQPERDFDHPRVPDETHAHLRPHVLYSINREDYFSVKTTKPS